MKNEKCFVLTMGAPASGKSTFIKKHFSDYKIIDVDEIVMEIGNNVYDRKNVSLGISRMRQQIKDSFQLTKTFVNVSTSRNYKSLLDKLRTGLENGFRTILIYFDVDTKICLERNKSRMKSGEKGLSDEYFWKIDMINQLIREYIQKDELKMLIDYLIIVK